MPVRQRVAHRDYRKDAKSQLRSLDKSMYAADKASARDATAVSRNELWSVTEMGPRPFVFIAGRKRNGTRPGHFQRDSSSVARWVLKSLEGMNLIENDPNGYAWAWHEKHVYFIYHIRLFLRSGRKITSQGQRDLDRIANQVAEQK